MLRTHRSRACWYALEDIVHGGCSRHSRRLIDDNKVVALVDYAFLQETQMSSNESQQKRSICLVTSRTCH